MNEAVASSDYQQLRCCPRLNRTGLRKRPLRPPERQRDRSRIGHAFAPLCACLRRGTPVLVVILCATVTGGCALKYTDASGRLHVVGLTRVTLTPAIGNSDKVSRIETSNIGVMIYATPASRGVSIGYNHEGVLYPDGFLPPSLKSPDQR